MQSKFGALNLSHCVFFISDFVSRHLCFVVDACNSPNSNKQTHFPWIFNGMGWTPDAGRRKSNGSLVISLKSSFICSSCILCHIMSISMQMKRALSLDLSHCCHICFVSVALSSLTLWFVLGHGFVCVREHVNNPKVFGMVPEEARQLHFQSQWQAYCML